MSIWDEIKNNTSAKPSPTDTITPTTSNIWDSIQSGKPIENTPKPVLQDTVNPITSIFRQAPATKIAGSTPQTLESTTNPFDVQNIFNPKSEIKIRPLGFKQEEAPTVTGPGGVLLIAKGINDVLTSTIEGLTSFGLDTKSAIKSLISNKDSRIQVPKPLQDIAQRFNLPIDQKGMVDTVANRTLQKQAKLDAESPTTPIKNSFQAFGEEVLPIVLNGFIASDVAGSAANRILKFTKSSPLLGVSSQTIVGKSAKEVADIIGKRFVEKIQTLDLTTPTGRNSATQLFNELKRLGNDFKDGNIPQLNVLGNSLDEMATRLNQNVLDLHNTLTPTGSKITTATEEMLPGYKAREGQPAPVGMSTRDVQPVGFGEQGKTPEVYQGEKDITTKVLQRLEGKSIVSKQFISDLSNQSDLKQQEKDVIRGVLDTIPDNNVNVKNFAEKVKSELLPLKVSETAGSGYNVQSGTGTHGLDAPRYEVIVLPDSQRGTVANYREKVYESPIPTSAGNVHFRGDTQNYFGHTRVEDMAGDKIPTRRVIEVQSDLYQKDNMNRETVFNYEQIKNNTTPQEKTFLMDLIKKYPYKTKLTEFYNNIPVELMSKNKLRTGLSDLELYNYIKDGFPDRGKQFRKLQQYSNPTAHFRMVREEIKQAAKDGKTALQFPTGETAMKIEGLGNNTLWGDVDRPGYMITPESLKVGKEIVESRPTPGDITAPEILGNKWIITDVLSDGKFKAVPKSNLGTVPLDEFYKKADATTMSRFLRNQETFDISGKVDTSNPIYKFYEKDLGRYLTNNYNAKIITDKQGVSWYELDVKSEATKQPVTAFKLGEPSSNNRSLDEIKKGLFDVFGRNVPIKSIFDPKLMSDPRAIGELKYGIIKLLEENGSLSDVVAKHEGWHFFKRHMVTAFERAEISRLEGELAAKFPEKIQTLKENGYGDLTPRQLAEELMADEFARYYQTGKTFFERLKIIFDRIIQRIKLLFKNKKDVLDYFKKIKTKISETPDIVSGPTKFKLGERIPNRVLSDTEMQALEKESADLKAKIQKVSPETRSIMVQRLNQIGKQMRQQFAIKSSIAKKKLVSNQIDKNKEIVTIHSSRFNNVNGKPVDNFPGGIITANREDRLTIEKGIRELNKTEQKQAFKEATTIKLSKELQDRAQNLIFKKEALDNNPLKKVIRYMARRGEFKGSLPEVTGKGKGLFSKKGDDILTETTGIDNTEQVREEFTKYIQQKKTFENEVKEFQIDKQNYLKEARAKRDQLLSEKKVEGMTTRTEKHITDILNTEAKKNAAIKRAEIALQESRKKLQAEEEAKQKYLDMVEKAHLSEADKKGIIAKFKAIFAPIEQTDPITKDIYIKWETSKLKAKEEGNDVYEEYKAKPNNDIPSIIEYEAGKKTPWIKEAFDSFFTDAKRAGLNLHYKEDYIPHVYKEKPEVIKEAVVKYMKDQNIGPEVINQFNKDGTIPEVIALRLKMRPSFQKIRTFPDYKTAMKYGLHPKFNTVAEHLGFYKEEMGKVLANKQLIDNLVSNGKLLDAYDAPESWVEVKLPGGLRRNYYASPNLATALNGQFRDEENLSFVEEFAKRVNGVSKFMQEVKLSAGVPATNINFFSIGQAIVRLTTAIGELAKLNPKGMTSELKAAYSFIRANFNKPSIQWLKDHKKYIDIMAEHNVPLVNRVDDYAQAHKRWGNIFTAQNFKDSIRSLKDPAKEVFTTQLFKHPIIQTGKTIVKFLDSRALGFAKDVFDKSFNEKTFASMMPQMQVQVFKDVYEGAIKNGLSIEDASKFASDTVRNEFGVINDLGRTKFAREVFSSVFFAPRFREGIINIFTNAAKSATSKIFDKTYSRNRSFLIGMVISFIIYNYINQKLNNGDNIWDNEPGHEFDLKVPIPDGKIIYTPFMPSVLSFVRNMASAGINFAQGRNDIALQKAGSLFSMPIKTASEIVSNQDYFGRPIYDVADSATVKAKKAIEHIGLAFTHPYFSELVKYFNNEQDIYKTLVMMTELPLKFSTEEKAAISRHYDALKAKTELNQKEQKNIEDMVKVYDDVQKLKQEGNTTDAGNIVDKLSDEEYNQYKILMKYDQIQALKKAHKSKQANQLGDTMSDEEYLTYTAIKTIRTREKRKDTISKTIQKETKPVYKEGDKLDDRSIISSIKTYADAIGTDPITAFNRIFSGQTIRRVDNGAIIVERMPFFASSKVKKDRGATSEMRLDHTIPLQLSGSNTESNLKLVPVDVWKSYTPIENYLGKMLRSGKISKTEAQTLIIKFKNGELKSQDIIK